MRFDGVWCSYIVTYWCNKNGMFAYYRLAAAQEAAGAQARAAPADTMGGAHQPATPGPSSLFIFSDENPIRRYVFIIILYD